MGGWFRDGFQGGRASPAACRGVIQMTAPISQTAFRGPGDNLIGGVLAHLRLADRLPLRVSCLCRAHWDDPAINQLRFEREVDLGTCGDLAAAMTAARTAVGCGLIPADRDAALRLVPQFITILDAEHCLVQAGDVQARQIRWCAPVDSDAEARRVVSEACGLRADARAAINVGDPTAAAQLNRARSLEGRLVDRFWRELAAAAVDQAQVA